jgi:hypothetical protein
LRQKKIVSVSPILFLRQNKKVIGYITEGAAATGAAATGKAATGD